MRTGKDVILEYCDNIKTGDIDYLSNCIDVRNSIRKGGVDHYDHCPSAMGLDNFKGNCYDAEDANKTQQDILDGCKLCWDRALNMEVPEEEPLETKAAKIAKISKILCINIDKISKEQLDEIYGHILEKLSL